MRRRLLPLLLLLTLMLMGCASWPWPQPAAVQLSTEATADGTAVQFVLHGYRGSAMPKLTVTGADGFDWTPDVADPVRQGDTTTVRLTRGLAGLVVEQFTYEWTLQDGTSVEGSVQYREVDFVDLDWELSTSDRLVVFHVGPLANGQLDRWEELLRQAEGWTGRDRTEKLVIWVFPDLDSLNDWAGRAFQVAGQWHGYHKRMMVYAEEDAAEQDVVMMHEMVHTTSQMGGPTWFEEGIAALYEGRYELRIRAEEPLRWAWTHRNLVTLQTEAQWRTIRLTEADYRNDPHLNPYTIGVSFLLFVKRHHGDAGLHMLFAASSTPANLEEALEELFRKPIGRIFQDWNQYLRQGTAVTDWYDP